MPAIESRPYRVPSQRSVVATVRAVQPQVELDELPDVWEPGHDIVLGITAELDSDFWEESGIPHDEPVTLVGVVTCLAARTRWRGNALFRRSADSWTATVEITVHGSAIAVELIVEAMVVGAGRTGHPDPERAIHRSARLWRQLTPAKVPLERLNEAFPTSAVSFAETGRLRVPWKVDVAPEAEPSWGLTSAIRLYVNTDLPVAARILDGTADRWIYQAMRSDIYTATLFQLAAVRDGYSSAEMSDAAESDSTSFAAFCAHVARVLGYVDLERVLTVAREEPMQLVERAREASAFMAEEN